MSLTYVINCTVFFLKIIKPKVFIEYRDMLQTELLVWSAAGIHPNILRLKDVFISDTRMYFVSGGLQLAGLCLT